MKRALLHSIEPGRICQVVNQGEEFEVNPAFSWVDVPDDTNAADRWDVENNVVIKYDVTKDPAFIEHGYKVARGIGYKSVGEQLDMLYKEIQATGTISSTGPWAQHITSIKAAIPKDDPAAVHAWNQAWVAANSGNISNS
jgi:hypothetical protein